MIGRGGGVIKLVHNIENTATVNYSRMLSRQILIMTQMGHAMVKILRRRVTFFVTQTGPGC